MILFGLTAKKICAAILIQSVSYISIEFESGCFESVTHCYKVRFKLFRIHENRGTQDQLSPRYALFAGASTGM